MPRHNTLSTRTYPHPFSQGLAGSTQTLWLFPQWKSGISAHQQGCRTTPPKYSSEDGSWHPDVHPVHPFLMLFSTTCFQVFLPQTGSLISFLHVLPSIFRKGTSMWQAPNFRDSACMLSILRLPPGIAIWRTEAEAECGVAAPRISQFAGAKCGGFEHSKIHKHECIQATQERYHGARSCCFYCCYMLKYAKDCSLLCLTSCQMQDPSSLSEYLVTGLTGWH